MAYPTAVNSQITDSVTQQSVSVLAAAPAMAMGSIYQSAAHSLGILFQNSTLAQHQAAICAQAAANQGVMQIYAAGSMGSAVATRRIALSNVPQKNYTRDILTALVILQLIR